MKSTIRFRVFRKNSGVPFYTTEVQLKFKAEACYQGCICTFYTTEVQLKFELLRR